MYTIKQAAARTGLTIPTIRAWERRYGVVSPSRTAARLSAVRRRRHRAPESPCDRWSRRTAGARVRRPSVSVRPVSTWRPWPSRAAAAGAGAEGDPTAGSPATADVAALAFVAAAGAAGHRRHGAGPRRGVRRASDSSWPWTPCRLPGPPGRRAGVGRWRPRRGRRTRCERDGPAAAGALLRRRARSDGTGPAAGRDAAGRTARARRLRLRRRLPPGRPRGRLSRRGRAAWSAGCGWRARRLSRRSSSGPSPARMRPRSTSSSMRSGRWIDPPVCFTGGPASLDATTSFGGSPVARRCSMTPSPSSPP